MSSASIDNRPPRAGANPDRITPPEAARLTRLSYPEQFNAVRWTLEEAFDPATGDVIPMPLELRVPYLTSSQLRKLSEDERAHHDTMKASRIAWARSRWMRVPAWGGRAAPGGEYRYSAGRCADWFERSLGASPDGGTR